MKIFKILLLAVAATLMFTYPLFAAGDGMKTNKVPGQNQATGKMLERADVIGVPGEGKASVAPAADPNIVPGQSQASGKMVSRSDVTGEPGEIKASVKEASDSNKVPGQNQASGKIAN